MTAAYVLVLIACLDENCARHIVARGMTSATCMSSSQIEAAHWVGEHPDWRIKEIRCELGDES